MIGIYAMTGAALVGLGLYGLIANGHLIWALVWSLLYLLGVVPLYGVHGTLDIAMLQGRVPAPAGGLALALIAAGLAVKTALFPFHI